MEELAMTELIERARLCADDHGLPEEAKICLLALCGVVEHRDWQLREMEVKWRYAEYNYASTMLELAQKKLKDHKDGKDGTGSRQATVATASDD